MTSDNQQKSLKNPLIDTDNNGIQSTLGKSCTVQYFKIFDSSAQAFIKLMTRLFMLVQSRTSYAMETVCPVWMSDF